MLPLKCSETDLNNLLDKLKEQTKITINALMKPDGEEYALKFVVRHLRTDFYGPTFATFFHCFVAYC